MGRWYHEPDVSEVTPLSLYLRRREFLARGVAGALGLAALDRVRPAEAADPPPLAGVSRSAT